MLNIILLGMISFFSDVSTEMVYPIIPLYLTAVCGATPAMIGVIEGIAESIASLLKVYSGYITDKYHKKKPIAFIGYATSVVYKIGLIFATTTGGVLVARIVDRLGKGIRTSPRDVLVAESANEENRGKAFGIHKALDMAGSAVGILLSLFILQHAAKITGIHQYRFLFELSTIPALISLVFFFFIKEKKQTVTIKKREKFWTKVGDLNPQLKLYLVIAFIFTLGNSSNAFLILRASNLGFSNRSVILLYFLYNIVASMMAIPCGKLSDRVGRKKLLTSGYLIFSIVYLGFGLASGKWMLIGAFALYGVFTAMTAGVERAFITDIAPTELRGTMLGLQSTIVGIALLPASMICGFLWNNFGPRVPFYFGAILGLCAAIVLFFGLQPKKNCRT